MSPKLYPDVSVVGVKKAPDEPIMVNHTHTYRRPDGKSIVYWTSVDRDYKDLVTPARSKAGYLRHICSAVPTAFPEHHGVHDRDRKVVIANHKKVYGEFMAQLILARAEHPEAVERLLKYETKEELAGECSGRRLAHGMSMYFAGNLWDKWTIAVYVMVQSKLRHWEENQIDDEPLVSYQEEKVNLWNILGYQDYDKFRQYRPYTRINDSPVVSTDETKYYWNCHMFAVEKVKTWDSTFPKPVFLCLNSPRE